MLSPTLNPPVCRVSVVPLSLPDKTRDKKNLYLAPNRVVKPSLVHLVLLRPKCLIAPPTVTSCNVQVEGHEKTLRVVIYFLSPSQYTPFSGPTLSLGNREQRQSRLGSILNPVQRSR